MASLRFLSSKLTISPIVKKGLLFSALYHLVMGTVLLVLLIQFSSPLSLTTLQERFRAWDGSTYMFMANHGYVTSGDQANYIVFYPLYPLLVAVTKTIIPDTYIAAIAITLSGSLLGHTLFYIFLKENPHFSKRADKIWLLLCCSPATIYFSMICTEGIFLLWSSAFLLALQRRKYAIAVAFGFLASLTRLLGAVFIIYYVMQLFEQHGYKKLHKALFLSPVIIGGYGLYIAINQILFSNPFYYQHILTTNWFKHVVNPIQQYIDTLRFVTTQLPTNPSTYPIDLLATLLVPAIVLLYVIKKREKVWLSGLAWTVATWLVITSQSYWLSNTRYISLILPLYIMIEDITSAHPLIYYLCLIGMTILAVVGISLFAQGGWIY